MGTRQIHFSDLSNQPILDEDEIVRLVVLEHPDLDGRPVELEATTAEVQTIENAPVTMVVFELHLPGEEVPERIVMESKEFDKLATDVPMSDLLKSAPSAYPARRATKAGANSSGRVNYTTLEYAGAPHKGRTTEAEARLVRENLDTINKRLAGAGQRTIDPTDPKMRERYGFTDQPAGVVDASD